MGRNFDDYPGLQPMRSWANTYAQHCNIFFSQWVRTILVTKYHFSSRRISFSLKCPLSSLGPQKKAIQLHCYHKSVMRLLKSVNTKKSIANHMDCNFENLYKYQIPTTTYRVQTCIGKSLGKTFFQ